MLKSVRTGTLINYSKITEWGKFLWRKIYRISASTSPFECNSSRRRRAPKTLENSPNSNTHSLERASDSREISLARERGPLTTLLPSYFRALYICILVHRVTNHHAQPLITLAEILSLSLSRSLTANSQGEFRKGARALGATQPDASALNHNQG